MCKPMERELLNPVDDGVVEPQSADLVTAEPHSFDGCSFAEESPELANKRIAVPHQAYIFEIHGRGIVFPNGGNQVPVSLARASALVKRGADDKLPAVFFSK